MKRFVALMIAVTLTLVGCGGDSSGGTNNNPTASFTASPQSGEAPLTVAFNASGSSDLDGSITSYAWDFGDGDTGTGQTLSHTYSAVGSYTVKLTVTDNDGASNSATKTIDVSDVTVQAAPAYLSFPGTSTATIDVTSSGNWTAETDQAWLQLSQSSGSGDATVTVTIDRSAITPDDYAGSILLKGGTSREVVTVYMRFPNLTGSVTNANGQITTSSAVSGQSSPQPISDLVPGVDYAPGQVLVRLNSGMAAVLSQKDVPSGALESADVESIRDTYAEMAYSLASDYSASTTEPFGPEIPLVVMRTDSDVPSFIEQLERDGRVARATPDYYRYSQATADDTYYGLQWHYADINLEATWDASFGSEDVTVAVIDGGFLTTHPDLSFALLDGYDFADNDDSEHVAGPNCGDHGTHVAGTIAAVTNNNQGVAGIAPSVNILPLKVGDNTTSNCPLPMSAIIQAIYYAAGANISGVGQLAQPVNVINLSLGQSTYSFEENEAVSSAIGNGVVVVAATGNDGNTSDPSIRYPAAYGGVIGVGATDYNENRAYYSNYGPEIDLVAPGGDLNVDLNGDGNPDGVLSTSVDLSTGDATYSFFQGTSMATPHVSAVAALILSVNRDLTPTVVTDFLRLTAVDLGISGPDTEYGYGLLDARSAVQLAQDTLQAPATDLFVRLLQGGTVLREIRPSSTGKFSFEGLASGAYTLEAGTDVDNDGVVGEVGEFYGSTSITVTYDGDLTSVGLAVDAQ